MPLEARQNLTEIGLYIITMERLTVYLPAILAFINFLIFLFYSLGCRITSRPNAFRNLVLVHIKFSLFYIFTAIFIQVKFNTYISTLDWIAGYFIYFGLHHTIFLYLYAIPQRSVSMNLCVSIAEKSGSNKLSLANAYGQGKGIQFVAKNRMSGIESLGFIISKNDCSRLTRFGIFIAKLHLTILKIWNLKPNSGGQNV